MSILEIISGVLLILSSIAIIILVLLQDSKGNGLAGVIGGGDMMMMDGRSRTPSSLMVKYTKVAAQRVGKIKIALKARWQRHVV